MPDPRQPPEADQITATTSESPAAARQEAELEEGLEETFPASDPLPLHPGSD